MCNSNKQSTTSEYSGIVPLSLIIKKDYKTSKLLKYNSTVPFLKLINDIIIFHLTEEFPLNKCDQAVVQIFITHFIPLLVLHIIHRGKHSFNTGSGYVKN